MSADESWDAFRARMDAATVGELRWEFVSLFAAGRRFVSECEAVRPVDPPSDLSGLIRRFREIDRRWDYVDDLLLERDDLTKLEP